MRPRCAVIYTIIIALMRLIRELLVTPSFSCDCYSVWAPSPRRKNCITGIQERALNARLQADRHHTHALIHEVSTLELHGTVPDVILKTTPLHRCRGFQVLQ